MSRNLPRRPSRTTTPKPRKIAGRDAAPADTTPADGAPAEDAADDAPTGGPPSTQPGRTPPRKPPTGPPADAASQEPDPGAQHARPLASPAVTRALLVLVGVLAGLLALQGLWFYLHDRENDDRAAAVSGSADDEDGAIPVPSGRPVVLNQLAVQEGVEAAAAAAQTMFARNWKTYDDGVDNAVTLMTEEFAEEYRSTTDDVRREFIAKKTDVQVHVVAQSVVRANEAELEALVFLNQYVFRGEGEDASTTYTPYRAVLRMVHTDNGWLVDGLETK